MTITIRFKDSQRRMVDNCHTFKGISYEGGFVLVWDSNRNLYAYPAQDVLEVISTDKD